MIGLNKLAYAYVYVLGLMFDMTLCGPLKCGCWIIGPNMGTSYRSKLYTLIPGP
jgi:hypothetical protein